MDHYLFQAHTRESQQYYVNDLVTSHSKMAAFSERSKERTAIVKMYGDKATCHVSITYFKGKAYYYCFGRMRLTIDTIL